MATIADERSVQMLVVWLKLSLELNQTAADAGSSNYTDLRTEMRSATLGLSTASYYPGVLCLLLSILFLFLLFLTLGLMLLMCWDLYTSRLPANLCSKPPSYEMVTKTDSKELPSYLASCSPGNAGQEYKQ